MGNCRGRPADGLGEPVSLRSGLMRPGRPSLAVLAAVLLPLHLLGLDAWLREHPPGQAGASVIRRIDVSFVKDLRPAPPPVVVAAPAVPSPKPVRRRPREPAAPAVAPPASAAAGPATPPSEPATVPAPTAWDLADGAAPGEGSTTEAAPEASRRAIPFPADTATPETLAERRPAASAAGHSASPPERPTAPTDASGPATVDASIPVGAAAAPASAAAAFEWPASTRLSYRLTGNYRGPVEGQAQVDWLRQGSQYQVHLEVSIGPFFAPLIERRMSSQGDLTADGLLPRLYEEETRVALRAPRRVLMRFDGLQLSLANGDWVEQPRGVQDSASQFVQMTYLFTTRPALLTTGRTVELPLALPRHVDRWFYDVVEEQTLHTSFGPVPTMHVKPRRAPRPGGDLIAEAWFAPTLQHLPIRILIRQDVDTYVDLMIERLPQQAEAPR